jgi:hypothetical protein
MNYESGFTIEALSVSISKWSGYISTKIMDVNQSSIFCPRKDGQIYSRHL